MKMFLDMLKNIQHFNKSDKKNKKFSDLAFGHHAEVLLITCVDPRLDPSLLTSSKPGEMASIRNPGNIIPPYDAEKKGGEAATLELFKNINTIIVCGHSDCAAMKNLFDEKLSQNNPITHDWLQNAPSMQELQGLVNNKSGHNNLAKTNILLQIEHLKSYPHIKKKLAENTLHIHGMFFDIAIKKVSLYDPFSESFITPIEYLEKQFNTLLLRRAEVIIQNEANRYLHALDNSENPHKKEKLAQIAKQFPNDNIRSIWPHIHKQVESKLWDMCSSYCSNRRDPKFQNLVAECARTELRFPRLRHFDQQKEPLKLNSSSIFAHKSKEDKKPTFEDFFSLV